MMLNHSHEEKLVQVILKATPLQDQRPSLGKDSSEALWVEGPDSDWQGWVSIALPHWPTPSSPWVTLCVWPTGGRLPNSTCQKLPGPNPGDLLRSADLTAALEPYNLPLSAPRPCVPGPRSL